MSASTRSSDSPVEILIAEDSPTQAQRLQHILQQQGYRVTVTTNGRQALEAARQRKPTLIISDVIMPEMDGYELCHRVKSDARLGNVPLILVTTLSDPQDVIRGLECRADNFILKPYDEHYLLSRVQFVLINHEMRRDERVGMGVQIFFNNQKHFITADRLQILNLLLSTYEAAIQRNKELQHSQEELQLLNTKLEAANQELESFSYSVSHDLRAPLRHVDGYIQMLVEDTASTLSSEARRHLNVITDASRQMGELIDNLLEFSRMGRAEMQESGVALDDLVREVIRTLKMTTDGRNIAWQIASLPRVVGDPAMLKQVFVNLLGNAVKYSRQRDPAQIELGLVGEEDGRLVLFVRDNGVGFDMQYADKLFGVF
ncbi:MAG: sensor histidine kinase, partial [Betaproteobacteria bacterium]